MATPTTTMRDRLIALGMRRPTRIKDQDADVPMLTMDDFEITAIPDSISCVPASCQFARNVEKQRELAVMCVEKAKLCVLMRPEIQRVRRAQCPKHGVGRRCQVPARREAVNADLAGAVARGVRLQNAPPTGMTAVIRSERARLRIKCAL